MRLALLGPVLALLLSSGCAVGGGFAGDSGGAFAMTLEGDEAQQLQQLRQRLQGFADRYLSRIEEASDDIVYDADTPPSLTVRQVAHETKYYTSLAIVSLAVEPDPRAALLDMMVMTYLERDGWDQPWCYEMLGQKHAAILIDAKRDLERDIWAVGGDYLSKEDLKVLRAMIQTWRVQNPDRKYLSSVRLSDFDEVRGINGFERKLGGGFLAPVGEATRAVDEVRALGERALFLGQRMPLLIAWQSETLALDVLQMPETQRTLANSDRLADSIERMGALAESVPALLEENTERYTAVIAEARSAIREADELAKRAETIIDGSAGLLTQSASAAQTLDQTLKTADVLVARFDNPDAENVEPGEPFDINDYGTVAGQLTEAVRELNTLVGNTEGLLASDAWTARITEINSAADNRLARATDEGQRWLRSAFWMGVLLILIAAVVAYIYRFTVARTCPKA